MSKTNTILTIPEPGKIELKEVPYPKIVPGYAIVKMKIAPICIEHWAYRNHTFELFDDAENLGHEGAGVVEEVLPGSQFRVGDRVAVFPHNGCGCDEEKCFICRDQLSTAHCMKNPVEEIVDFDDPHAPLEAIGGEQQIYMPGFMKIIERINGSESGGFAMQKYRIVQERHIVKLPDDMDLRYAALSQCSCGATFTASEETFVKPGDTVLIAGAGFMGLAAIINAKYRNARVIVLGRHKWRMELAKKLGADLIVNPEDEDWLQQVHEFTGEYKGADVVFEGSGHPFYQRKALQAVRRYGHMYWFGFTPDGEPLPIDILLEIMNRHIHLTGGHDERVMHRDRILRMLNTPELKEKLDLLISHEFNMSEADKAFEVMLSKKSAKVFLYPWDDAPE